METIKTICLACCLSVLVGCAGPNTPQEIVRAVKKADSGYRNSIEVGDIAISAMYKPAFYTIALAQLNGLEFTEASENATNEESFSFELRFDVKKPGIDLTNIGLKEEAEFSERINYLSFGMAHDVFITCGKDTIHSELFHFERDYQISDKNVFTVIFPKHRISEDPYLHIYPRFLNCGPVKLKFDQRIFKISPSII